jgi:HAE1 family hydrophobic/amphiphilic exporter-1
MSDEPPAIREPRLVDSIRSMDRFRFTTTRPVAVLMVFIAIMVFGAFSVRLLPLNLMPEISYPKLTVRAEYEGAAPAEVENDVARPLEEVLGVVTGLTRVSSISRAGYCDVVMEFTWDTDMDEANQDVLEKLDIIKPALPEEVKQPLILRYDPTLDPVLVLSLSGEGQQFGGVGGLKYLRRIADRDVRRLLEPIDGVAAVKVRGGLEEEIHVELDEDALRRTNVSIATVIQRLDAENINLAGGSMREGRTRYLIRTVNEFQGLDDIRDTVIISSQGRDIKLRDLATVESGYKDREVITRVDGQEAVEVEVYKEADANIVEMAKSVRTRLDEKVTPRLARDHQAYILVVSDRSTFIESSINEVLDTAIFGGLLAIIVLFFFLRNFKSTAIVAVAIPMSVVITFAPLNLSGVSLNIMSLGGMALGIGMLVDNSIVVLESIHRCREEGDELLRATIRGTSEVGSAVFASTLTSIAVFFPMVFVEGVAGQMFGDLGLTVVFSLLASLGVALFFIPMLASRQAPDKSDEAGLWTRLKRRWSSWASFRDLVDVFRNFRLWYVLPLGVPVVYFLARFLIHLQFELVAKLLSTGAGVFAEAGLGIARGVAFVLGKIVAPLLWGFDKALGVLSDLYRGIIRWSLRNAVVVIGAALACFVAMGIGAARLDSELIPELHQSEFTVELTMPVGMPLDETDKLVKPLEQELIKTVPRLRSIVTTIGTENDNADAGERGEHTAQLELSLDSKRSREAERKAKEPKSEWNFSFDAQSGASGPPSLAPPEPVKVEIPEREPIGVEAPLTTPIRAEIEAMAAVRESVKGIPDLDSKTSRPVLFSFKTPVEVEIRGYDLIELGEATAAVGERLEAIDGLRDVKVSIRPGNPEIQVVYDRDALARHGLDIRTVAELVRDKVQGYEATKYTRKERKIPVRVRLADINSAGVDELRELVVNPGGMRPIPLEAVAEVVPGRGPNEIRRIGQQRVGLVTANIEGIGLGSATTGIHAALAELELPPGVTTAVTGQSEEWETSSRSLYLALGLSIFLVYVIMASQFESLAYPLIILVSIPLAMAGVVLALLVLNIPVSVIVFLGAIMLAGIVVNNAIVLVDYVNQLKNRGHATDEALELAGQIRLRPILMTTLTTVLGLVPMAVGLGDGAEIRQPMAITVIAGLSASTLLTLVVIPTLYHWVDKLLGRETGTGAAARLERDLEEVDDSLLAPEDYTGGED